MRGDSGQMLGKCGMMGGMTHPVESLHSHTSLSDGDLSHKEAFEHCENLGYGVLAFTDHDSLPGDDVLQYLETLRGKNTKWIMGIEFTSGAPSDLDGAGDGSVHIVGLFTDPTNEELREHCRKTQLARVVRIEEMCAKLNEIGYKIDKDKVLARATGLSVGLPHLVAELNLDPKNRDRTRELMENWRVDAQSEPKLARLYYRAMQRDEEQHPYSLFFNNAKYIEDVHAKLNYKVDLDESVRLIRNAGGIGILAHYFYLAKDMLTFPHLETLLREKRLDGMEIRYGKPKGYDNTRFENDRNRIKEIVHETGALATGGADAHSKEDFERFATNKTFSGETIGMTAEILRLRPDISTRWSSLL
ncbi:MAG: hypothetical protein COV07_02380 [Candidatus Vogelbacteria bacterium CG10_big_fil_rev_8_21_14_0_10_45_14]|uniref:PHP domain-containing protein n=1 Tax=Candidatus Vogelbacteria bacterium CG10_big_fil_rev_8_21_14_0_10_45_14 TaxID=1975042 RepID=A0A2H0RLZ7_9BACT|nr:MAG: hypothetical protein COV07_02380 [Candidatus Vogelbacteria bacterium CG10_big_fil_rev_8_21_14_0_10_45_14]